MIENMYSEKEIPYSEIAAHEPDYTKWNYSVPEESGLWEATGYESVEADLKKYNSSDFFNASLEDREKIIDYVVDIYERIGIYPIKYYSKAGARNEILKCINYEAKFEGDRVSTGQSVGTSFCSWVFPNLFKTPSLQDMTPDKEGGESAWDKFYNRKFLRRVISFCYNYNYKPESGVVGYPGTNPMSGIRMIGSVPTNFRPTNAKAVYERFTPPGGTIYDFASGFGGRLLGTLSSKNNYNYVGVDPDTETMFNLHRLGGMIEEVTGRTGSYDLHCCGSEDFCGEKNSIDFSFSSPPYFTLEMYGSDGGDFNYENQCFNKFPELDDWMEGYVRKTIQNIGYMLKKRRYYAVNIADFKYKGGSVNYVKRWSDISAEEGMPLYDTVYLGVRARSGSKLLGDEEGSLKNENILLFKKK